MERLTVTVPPAYDVLVGVGALVAVADAVGARRTVAVVSQPGVLAAHGDAVLDAVFADRENGAGAVGDQPELFGFARREGE